MHDCISDDDDEEAVEPQLADYVAGAASLAIVVEVVTTAEMTSRRR